MAFLWNFNSEEIVKKDYDNVYIELENVENFKTISSKIEKKGQSKIKFLIRNNKKNYSFELKDKRKFDYNTLKTLKKEPNVRKITI